MCIRSLSCIRSIIGVCVMSYPCFMPRFLLLEKTHLKSLYMSKNGQYMNALLDMKLPKRLSRTPYVQGD